MLIFNNWKLMETGGVLAYQYDNKTRTMLVTGDIPDGWVWDMMVSVGENMDIIRLSPMEGGFGVVLTAEMLSISGHYNMQLRGTQGDFVRHTNKIVCFIPPSLSGDANWPEVPSEFTQVEKNITAAAEKYPRIGDNGHWWVWDVEFGTWKDTGVSASGGSSYDVDGETLVLKEGVLTVNTTDVVMEGNVQPITSNAVAATVGNIEVILKTI